MSANNASLHVASSQRVKVWDALVRVSHWTLAASIVLAWLSAVIFGWTRVHQPTGYVALAVVSIRVVWGFVGTRYARFRDFVYAPRFVCEYLQQIRHGHERRYLGHNPLGGWMVIALLGTTLLTGFTGWLFTTDTFWGMYWLKQLHLALAWLLVVLIVLHIAGVIFTSIKLRENLLRAMCTGYKLR